MGYLDLHVIKTSGFIYFYSYSKMTFFQQKLARPLAVFLQNNQYRIINFGIFQILVWYGTCFTFLLPI